MKDNNFILLFFTKVRNHIFEINIFNICLFFYQIIFIILPVRLFLLLGSESGVLFLRDTPTRWTRIEFRVTSPRQAAFTFRACLHRKKRNIGKGKRERSIARRRIGETLSARTGAPRATPLVASYNKQSLLWVQSFSPLNFQKQRK